MFVRVTNVIPAWILGHGAGTFPPSDGSNGMDQKTSEAPDARIRAMVREAQRGEPRAFDDLVREFQGQMYNLAFRMTNNAEDAADLTQEIFVKVYRSLGKFRGESQFSTWLHAVAANTCRSGLRKLRRIAWFETHSLDEVRGEDDDRRTLEPADPGSGPAENAQRHEKAEEIGAAVAALPEDFRMVLVMRDIQGASYEEMAKALRLSIGTVKSRLCRARFKVKEELVRKGSHAM